MTSSQALQRTPSVADYINSIVGTPWVEGVTDCYWVVEDSYRVLDGIVLPTPPWRAVDGIAASANEMLRSGAWLPSKPVEGAIIAVYDKDGVMCHVGRILAGLAVHSDGTRKNAGQCRAEPLADMQKRYARLGYRLEYYKYGDN